MEHMEAPTVTFHTRAKENTWTGNVGDCSFGVMYKDGTQGHCNMQISIPFAGVNNNVFFNL